ncbi:MAG: NTP transferase domain-containing protein [Lachnospiraceae bacterium]|nr:NTP transferase domain-containing protein [Lachnospiraceae bacterium]
MNKTEKDTLLFLKNHSFLNQRIVAEQMKLSLGKVNQTLRSLQDQGYLKGEMNLTDKALTLFSEHAPRRAVILAAGYGMRMVPIHRETPKGLLQINGEPLIERQIRQLQEVGITDITVVVGFMKESYEYLIDTYGVKLLINMEYAKKNNLHSLNLASDKIENTYIIPCDIWCQENPFCRNELYSWYMVCELVDDESSVRVNRKQELVKTNRGGNQMIGISYVTGDTAVELKNRIAQMDGDFRWQNSFWEEALFLQDKMIVFAKVASSLSTYEINTYEQLRELDASCRQLHSQTIQLIAQTLQVLEEDIRDITILKKGMTNRSFLFTCRNQSYIMRIPGEGTEQLINRRQESQVYEAINGLGISDDLYYINPENGCKITAFLENARTCDPENLEEVRACMKRLREFHKRNLKVEHTFDLYQQIEFYETLWNGASSCYQDYNETKGKVYRLKGYIDRQPKEWTLTHIDAVSDNFLFIPGNPSEEEEIRLIDWEYAGMQDPHVDIAMFAIYAMYDREQVEKLIEAYFSEGCDPAVRRKIYCYIATCGLLWSNWCEYKRQLGVEFGEYSIRQYRYAKEYYKIFQEEQHELSC